MLAFKLLGSQGLINNTNHANQGYEYNLFIEQQSRR